jgi:O-antigen/teichoic acid export membrane protein
MIGRWTNPIELGLYAIGVSTLQAFLTVQAALISLPYTVQRHSPIGTAAERAGNALMQCGLLSILTIAILAVAAFGLGAHDARPEVVLILTLAGVAPFVLLREFGRQFAFAHLHAGRALWLDGAVVAIQLAALSWLGLTGRLTSSSAYAAIGVGCALPSLLWLYLARADFAIRMAQLRTAMKRSWSLGKWVFGSNISYALQVYLTYLLLAWLVGKSATGIYAAGLSIATLCNPLILGLGNILLPRGVLAFKEGNIARLQREVTWDLLLRVAPMALFCLVIFLVGEELLYLLYGSEYAGHAYLLSVLTFMILAAVAGFPASNALLSMEHPREIFQADVLSAALAVALIWLFVGEWGLLGAAYASLIGNLVRTTGYWIAFLILAASHGMRTGSTQRDRHFAGLLTK